MTVLPETSVNRLALVDLFFAAPHLDAFGQRTDGGGHQLCEILAFAFSA
jgi:hypothetical protein